VQHCKDKRSCGCRCDWADDAIAADSEGFGWKRSVNKKQDMRFIKKRMPSYQKYFFHLFLMDPAAR
jgi:hypothetical protein